MGIKKADSKGRVTGFTPGVYYRVGRTESGTVLSALGNDRLGVAIQEGGALPKEALEYLRGFGIDPHSVPRDSATPEGYAEYIYRPDGKPEYKYGQRVVEPREWPYGFSWNQFSELILAKVEW